MEKYLDLKNNKSYKDLEIPANIIKNGGIVVFPTETVYGIGTNGLDKEAVERLYKVKERPLSKPISLLVSDFEMIERVAKNISEIEYKIIKKFFPGPLTIILNKKDIVPDIVTSGGSTVGIRMPDEEITRKLIEYAGVPIAAPSANISDKPCKIDVQDIIKEFGDSVDYFIDGGKSKLGISSTIVKVENNTIKILREGSISKKEIENAIK
jgi:L-threonylcarbamoyladenylate synthase